MSVETGFVDVDGGSLYYECSGDGPALVVNAGALDVRLWEPQVEALSQVCTFVRVDLCGYGRSSDLGMGFGKNATYP